MKTRGAVELGLTIPLQRHLHIKALPYSQEPDCRFCWDLHIIPLRGRPSLLDGLRLSLSVAGFPAEETKKLCGSELPLFTRTHGRREVAFLNRAWEDVMVAELALDESSQSQPLLDQLVNAKLSRCAGIEGLDTAARRLTEMLSQI